ncbi:hypothetical protein SBADM41S_03459 [Streptomyces badius]
MWGVNGGNQIFRYAGDQGAWNPWTHINGSLVRIDAGSRTNVWGVDSADAIYRYTNHDANPWIKIPGALSDIGAGADGTVWGVNSGGQIFRYTGDQDSANPWKNITGGLSRIAAVVPDQRVGRQRRRSHLPVHQQRRQPLDQHPRHRHRHPAGADGTAWHVNKNGDIFRYTGDQPS